MSDFKKYKLKLLVWLTNFLLKRNDHVSLDGIYFGITFLQKLSRNTAKQYTLHFLILDVAFTEMKPQSRKEI